MKSLRLDEVCEIIMGQAPSGEAYNNDGNGWPLIAGAGDFGDTKPQAKKFTTEASKLSRIGDIVLGIRASIGEKVVADGEYCLGRGVAGLRARASLETRFLWHWLSHSASRLALKAKGATFKQVNRDDIGELEILLPPLPEQRRIAAVLDKAEALRALRRDALAELDALTQAIFMEMFGDPACNSKKLPKISLGELGEWASGGTPPRSQKEYFEGSIPWFSSGELNDMFALNSKEHISQFAIRETTARAVPKNALMLGMYDTAALKASISGVDCSCNQAIAFATINPEIAETLFVYYSIIIGREHFRRLQRGVRQKNLNLSMIREISIPKPPLPLQREFARRVAAVEKLKASHRESLAELDALFAALQYRAFRGELTFSGFDKAFGCVI